MNKTFAWILGGTALVIGVVVIVKVASASNSLGSGEGGTPGGDTPVPQGNNRSTGQDIADVTGAAVRGFTDIFRTVREQNRADAEAGIGGSDKGGGTSGTYDRDAQTRDLQEKALDDAYGRVDGQGHVSR